MSNKKFLIVIIFSIFSLVLLVLGGLATNSIRSAIPDDAYEIELDESGRETGTVLFNPKYNILEPVNPALFQKPYCQNLADSRMLQMANAEDIQKYRQQYLTAADIAEKEGDVDFAKTLREAYTVSETNNSESLTQDQIGLRLTLFDKIVTASSDLCGFRYTPYPDPKLAGRISNKLAKSQPDPDNVTNETTTETVPESNTETPEPFRDSSKMVFPTFLDLTFLMILQTLKNPTAQRFPQPSMC